MSENGFEFDGKCWKEFVPVIDLNGNEEVKGVFCSIVDVSVDYLLMEWENLVCELSEKEVLLSNKKEEYANKEFEIVFMSDVNFKELYGSTSEKVRKQHAKTELSELDNEIKTLELSINWIRSYIPLLREVVRCKQ